MKKKHSIFGLPTFLFPFSILVLLNCLFSGLQAQTDPQAPHHILASSVSLTKTGDNAQTGESSSSLHLADPIAKAIQVLGKPDKVSDLYLETEDKNAKLYAYRGNLLYFVDGVLTGFELKDNLIQIRTVAGKADSATGLTFKVGDRLQVDRQTPVGKRFYTFPLVFEKDQSRGIAYRAISLNYLTDGSVRLDSKMELLFDANDRLINVCLTN